MDNGSHLSAMNYSPPKQYKTWLIHLSNYSRSGRKWQWWKQSRTFYLIMGHDDNNHPLLTECLLIISWSRSTNQSIVYYHHAAACLENLSIELLRTGSIPSKLYWCPIKMFDMGEETSSARTINKSLAWRVRVRERLKSSQFVTPAQW